MPLRRSPYFKEEPPLIGSFFAGRLWQVLTPVFCILIAFSLAAQPVYAQEAKLTHIVVTNTRDDLLFYLRVEGAFREDMKRAILSGVPATFSFFIQLYKDRSLWLDKEIVELKVTHTIRYNPVKKEFSVTRSWENTPPVKTRSFLEAQKLMTEIDSLKVVELERLEKGRQYQIRAKAELSKRTLPFYLHYVLFFIALWDFETDWYTTDFIY
ncbi:MAG: DUF4390 domain-containing protein [Deltaproteobacteria bacterium]|nr:DUF4390 domain-containing protein [Deltaproteobacteria bacterium]MBW1954097.1 DUF4390 domain-containing protein [Deltaproteobacteria bacterium]MBW2040987.1 DUF4390 domain-containing protein [Deltaproteobacteria bacterium]